MMRSILFISLSFLAVSLSAQRGGNSSLFNVDANHRSNGFLIGLGATQLFGQADHELDFLALRDIPEVGQYRGAFEPNGKLGFHIELGMFWITDRSFFDYVDLNLAYSQHRGEEVYTANLLPLSADTLPSILAGSGQFGDDVVSIHFNFNKAIPIKDYLYGIAALGGDFSYRVISDYSYEGSHPSLIAEASDDALRMHFNAKLGVGYKTSSSSWLSLTAETPFQTVIPFDGLKSRKDFFNSKYRPVTFTLRYQWLRKRPARECPTGPKENMKKKRKRGRKGMRDGQI